MSDDHANAAIGVYNSWLKPVVKTPNIDKLAKQGMLFKQSMVTNSICTPSRATIITGKYSHLNGVPVFNRFEMCIRDRANRGRKARSAPRPRE